MIHGPGPDGRYRKTGSQISITQNNWDIQSTLPLGLQYLNVVEKADIFRFKIWMSQSDLEHSTARTLDVQVEAGHCG